MIWRLIIYTITSTGLIFFLLKDGWKPIYQDRIIIKGSSRIKPELITRASGISFPKGLLEINPKLIEKALLTKLPVEKVSVQRQLIKNTIEIGIEAKEPIAFANRKTKRGISQGIIDNKASWIPMNMAHLLDKPSTNIVVYGWSRGQKKLISEILNNREKFGSPLQKIKLNPNGEVTLSTIEFENIELGSNSNQLLIQIKVINHLSKNLPSKLLDQKDITIDIRDPSKPELQNVRSLTIGESK